MSAQSLGDRRDDLGGYAEAIQAMVHRGEITAHKYGANAVTIKRMLGVKSYNTAWAWLHKFRRAMVRPGREKLSGVVEVDETYVGGEEEGGQGRFTETNAIVAGAIELKDKGYGRVRLRHIPDVKTGTLEQFVTDGRARRRVEVCGSRMGARVSNHRSVWEVPRRGGYKVREDEPAQLEGTLMRHPSLLP